MGRWAADRQSYLLYAPSTLSLGSCVGEAMSRLSSTLAWWGSGQLGGTGRHPPPPGDTHVWRALPRRYFGQRTAYAEIRNPISL